MISTHHFPNYRAEIWFKHEQGDAEDRIEETLRDFMNEHKCYVQGVAVYRIHPF